MDSRCRRPDYPFPPRFWSSRGPLELKCCLSQQLQGPTWLQLLPPFHPTAGIFYAGAGMLLGSNFHPSLHPVSSEQAPNFITLSPNCHTTLGLASLFQHFFALTIPRCFMVINHLLSRYCAAQLSSQINDPSAPA